MSSQLKRRFEPAEHGVEGVAQMGEFVRRAFRREPPVEVRTRNGRRLIGHPLDRLDRSSGQQPASECQQCDEQRSTDGQRSHESGPPGLHVFERGSDDHHDLSITDESAHGEKPGATAERRDVAFDLELTLDGHEIQLRQRQDVFARPNQW